MIITTSEPKELTDLKLADLVGKVVSVSGSSSDNKTILALRLIEQAEDLGVPFTLYSPHLFPKLEYLPILDDQDKRMDYVLSAEDSVVRHQSQYIVLTEPASSRCKELMGSYFKRFIAPCYHTPSSISWY